MQLGEMQRTLEEARCTAQGASEVAHIATTASQLDPLLAHSGLLGHRNRTAALDGRAAARRRGGDPSGEERGEGREGVAEPAARETACASSRAPAAAAWGLEHSAVATAGSVAAASPASRAAASRSSELRTSASTK